MVITWEFNNISNHFLTQKSNQDLSPSLLYSAEYLMMWVLSGWEIDQKFHSVIEQQQVLPWHSISMDKTIPLSFFP